MIVDYIKSCDYFGHPALMHFGRDPAKKQEGDDTVKTLIGAVYSIILRIAYAYTVYYYAKKMFTASDNNVSTVDINADWSALAKE